MIPSAARQPDAMAPWTVPVRPSGAVASPANQIVF